MIKLIGKIEVYIEGELVASNENNIVDNGISTILNIDFSKDINRGITVDISTIDSIELNMKTKEVIIHE